MDIETTNDTGNEESITDIVNSLVAEESNQEPEGIEVDVAKAKQQESQNRSQAMQTLRKEQTTVMTAEAKKAVGSYKQQLEEMRKELAEIKRANAEKDKKYQTMEKDLQVHSDRMLTDDVIAKENQLAKHPKYGQFFDRDAVRKHYINAAQSEKRYFDPEESFKILNHDKILEKLERFERQNEFRKVLMEGGMTQSNNTPETDGLSDVKTSEDISAYMRKVASNLGLG